MILGKVNSLSPRFLNPQVEILQKLIIRTQHNAWHLSAGYLLFTISQYMVSSCLSSSLPFFSSPVGLSNSQASCSPFQQAGPGLRDAHGAGAETSICTLPWIRKRTCSRKVTTINPKIHTYEHLPHMSQARPWKKGLGYCVWCEGWEERLRLGSGEDPGEASSEAHRGVPVLDNRWDGDEQHPGIKGHHC